MAVRSWFSTAVIPAEETGDPKGRIVTTNPNLTVLTHALVPKLSQAGNRATNYKHVGRAPHFAAITDMDTMAVVYARELTRWGIETSIIVPGAFTGGTNHFAHAGQRAGR
jgi:hypothetical protein